VSDPSYANRCLLSAEHIFDLANLNPGTLLTAAPQDYYPETEWKSDLELGAAELYFATAAGSLPSGLPHSDPSYYLTKAAHWAKAYMTDSNHGSDTLNVYDVSGLSHYEVYRALAQAGNPSGLEVSQSDLANDLKSELDHAVSSANSDPFRLGFPYAQFDVDSHTLGYATTAYLYKKMTGSSAYSSFAQNQRDWILGRNAWGSSFIVGAGTTFPFCMQHQVANLAGSLTGGSPIVRGAVVNGPNASSEFTGLSSVGKACPPAGGDKFSAFTGKSTRYMDDVRTWQSSEPALDMSALGPIVFAEQLGSTTPPPPPTTPPLPTTTTLVPTTTTPIPTTTTPIPTTTTPIPTTTVPPSTNVAYQKTATSSSNESNSLLPANAVDGSTSTRWASVEGVDPQWLEVDLGANYAVTKVVLKWEAAYAKAYSIQLSSDGTTWNTVYSTSTGAGGNETLTVSGNGRYIRMYGTKRGTSYGYSLWEFEVYGSSASSTPTPSATTNPPTTNTTTATPTTSTVPPTTTQSGIPAWQPNTAYTVGQQVTYQSNNYQCLQSHTSQVGWEPSNAPALWQLL
jgi:hypothetical protein